MRIRTTILACFLFLLFASFGKRGPVFNPETKLAFSLNMYANSGPVTFAVLIVWNGDIGKRTYITKESFMRIATGEEYSKANPDSLNLFIEHEIVGCTIEKDSVFEEIIYNFGTINDIWKLRYSSYPFEGASDNIGWAAHPMMPSEGQEKILQDYGVKYYSDWIIADEAFRLLHDMQDPEWVTTYKGS